MLNPRLSELYAAACAAHPIARKEAERLAMEEIAEHFGKAEASAHQLINSLEQGKREACVEILSLGSDLFYSRSFREFRVAVETLLGNEPLTVPAESSVPAADLVPGPILVLVPDPPSELPKEASAEPVAQPDVPALPPLPLDPPLVLPPVDGLNPGDAQPGEVDQPIAQDPAVVLGNEPG